MITPAGSASAIPESDATSGARNLAAAIALATAAVTPGDVNVTTIPGRAAFTEATAPDTPDDSATATRAVILPFTA